MLKNELAYLPYSSGSSSFCRAMVVDDVDSMPGDARIAFPDARADRIHRLGLEPDAAAATLTFPSGAVHSAALANDLILAGLTVSA